MKNNYLNGTFGKLFRYSFIQKLGKNKQQPTKNVEETPTSGKNPFSYVMIYHYFQIFEQNTSLLYPVETSVYHE